MNTKQWMEEIKTEILHTAQALGQENLADTTHRLRQYVTILEALQQLAGPHEPESRRSAGDIVEINDPINHLYQGRFSRKLSGGTIGSAQIFVPESVVRNQRIDEGDWVRAKAIKSIVQKSGNLRTLYEYTIVQKNEEITEGNRTLLRFCKVEYDPQEDHLFLDTPEYGRLPIADSDARHLDIGEGDLVDFAFYKNEAEKGKAIWKYKLPPVPIRIPEAERLDRTMAKQFFPERSYVVVGELKEALRVQEEIEENGGLVSFLTGDERFDIMERIGTAGDTVVVVLDTVTPHGLNKINDIGEKYRLPMLFTRDAEAEPFLQLLMEENPVVPGVEPYVQ